MRLRFTARGFVLALLIAVNLFLVIATMRSEVLGINEIDFTMRTVASPFWGEGNLFSNIYDADHVPLYFYVFKMVLSLSDGARWSFFVLPVLLSTMVVVLSFLFIEKSYSLRTAYLMSPFLVFSLFHHTFSHEVEENLFFGAMLVLLLYTISLLLYRKKRGRAPRTEIVYYIVLFLFGFSHNYFLYVFLFLAVFWFIRMLAVSTSHLGDRSLSKRCFFGTLLAGSIPVMFILKNVSNYVHFSNPSNTQLFSLSALAPVLSFNNDFWWNILTGFNIYTFPLPWHPLIYDVLWWCFALFALVGICIIVYQIIRSHRRTGILLRMYDRSLPLVLFVMCYALIIYFPVTRIKYHTFYFLYLLLFLSFCFLVFCARQALGKRAVYLDVAIFIVLVVYAVFSISFLISIDYDAEVSPSAERFILDAEQETKMSVSQMRFESNEMYPYQAYLLLLDRRFNASDYQDCKERLYDPDMLSPDDIPTGPIMIVDTMPLDPPKPEPFAQRLLVTHRRVLADCAASVYCGYVYVPR